MERKALGRGLTSLITTPLSNESAGRVLRIPIHDIRPNPHQPRQEWDEDSLTELSASIREHGVLQPLIVRGTPGRYELVAGERRLRACRMAGLTHVPALLRDTDESGSLKLALIENIQREDISPLDAAHAYQSLIDEFNMTQEDVSAAVGKSRSAIANTLRLLKLPAGVQESLRRRSITEGHARCLISVEDPSEQERLLRLAEDGASVREIEAAARGDAMPGSGGAVLNPSGPVVITPAQPENPGARPGVQLLTTVKKTHPSNPYLDSVVEQLRLTLGVKVEIRGDQHRGLLCLEYYTEEDLQALADRLLA